MFFCFCSVFFSIIVAFFVVAVDVHTVLQLLSVETLCIFFPLKKKSKIIIDLLICILANVKLKLSRSPSSECRRKSLV